jgi:carbon-monoxide dehydrogenase large subunit
MLATGPYRIENVRLTGYAVYTNMVPGGAFRGFGDPQVCFAYDSQIDAIAHALGMDPVELRLKNLVEEGEQMPSGQTMRSVTARECLRAAAEAIGYRPDRPRQAGRGIGFACADALYGGFPSGANVRVNEDGTAVVVLGTTDIGQGMETAMVQIAAAELGLRVEDVSVSVGDTDAAPFDMGSFGSRVTFHTGNAVKRAAAEVRRQLLAAAAEMLEANADDLELAESRVAVRGDPDRTLTVAQVARFLYFSRETTITASGTHGAEEYDIPLKIDGTQYGVLCTNAFSAQAAEVEVDPETGEVRLLRLVAALDCGKAINPQLVEGQIEGGAATGVGLVLWEELLHEDGRPVNAEFMDYLVPTAQDVPHIAARIVELPQHDGPFGAKGVGDGPPTGTTAAIANAVFDATGVRIRQLPLTPERVLAALAEAGSGSR